jgi:hypothetical protein
LPGRRNDKPETANNAKAQHHENNKGTTAGDGPYEKGFSQGSVMKRNDRETAMEDGIKFESASQRTKHNGFGSLAGLGAETESSLQ